MTLVKRDLFIPYLFCSFFFSMSSLTSVAGGVSTLVAGTSTVTMDWAATVEGEVVGPDGEVVGPECEVLGPDGGGIGNGKGDPGEKVVVLNWLFCESIWPIKVLKACCIAYFWKKIQTIIFNDNKN